MSNHIRCPMCGHNARYSRFARKVVRHYKMVREEIAKYEFSHGHITEVQWRRGDVCVVSGMKEGEVRNLTRTMLAFDNVTVYLHPSNVP